MALLTGDALVAKLVIITWVCAILGERNSRWFPGQPSLHIAYIGLI